MKSNTRRNERKLNRKLVFSVVGVVAVLVVAASLVVVYASPITLDELAS